MKSVFPLSSLFATSCLISSLLLSGCIDTNGEVGECPATLPEEKVIPETALHLIPKSRCDYRMSSDSASLDCHDEFALQASIQDTTNVFAHFTLNNFVLRIDDLTRYIPVPSFGAGTSWKCPEYRVTNKVDLQRVGLRTSYRITLSKGTAIAKDWTLINHLDSAALPEITVESTADGLKVTYLPKPGTVLRSAYSYGVGATVELRATPFSSQESFSIFFKSHPAFNASIDSLSLRNDQFHFCADSDSTLQSMSVNGEMLPARASVCRTVDGGAAAAVYAYRRRFCVDCL